MVGRQCQLISTPLDPPVLWLDITVDNCGHLTIPLLSLNFQQGSLKILVQYYLIVYYHTFFKIVFALGGSLTPHPISSRPHLCM
jgi:hypothetical protein